jgi:multidrug resistance efflux pump
MRTGPLREEIARLEKAVERAKTKVTYSEREYERVGELYRKNLVAQHEYETAEQELNLDRKDLERAESDLRVLQAGNRPEKIREAEAEVERLRATREFLSGQIAKTIIRSPIPGVVATHRLRDKLGGHVDVGDEVCQIVDCAKMLLEMPVSERDVMDIGKGMKVKLKARAIPEKSFYGRVASVPPVAIDSNDRTVLIVTSEVDNAHHLLKPGMTGTAKIYCGKRAIIDLLTRKIIRFVRVEFWWW